MKYLRKHRGFDRYIEALLPTYPYIQVKPYTKMYYRKHAKMTTIRSLSEYPPRISKKYLISASGKHPIMTTLSLFYPFTMEIAPYKLQVKTVATKGLITW